MAATSRRSPTEDQPSVEVSSGVAGGGRSPRDRGFFVNPTVFADVDNKSRIAREEMAEENKRIGALRDRLLKGVSDIEHVYVNGDLDRRVPHNLNVSFAYVEGESMLMAIKDLAVSSGSACTSASLEPSYVLRALGRDDELAHSSIRFTIGRFNTEEEIDFVIKLLHEKIGKLRELSPLWEMVQEGVDLNTVQWAAH